MAMMTTAAAGTAAAKKMYELDRAHACAGRRAFEGLLTEKDPPQKLKAAAVKKALHELVDGTLAEGDVGDRLEELFADIPYGEEQRKAQAARSAEELLWYWGYLSRYKGMLLPVEPMDVELAPGFVVRSTPDFLMDTGDGKEIRLIKVRVSKPYAAASTILKEDIGLRAMIEHAKALIPAGEIRCAVFACYDFIRPKEKRPQTLAMPYWQAEGQRARLQWRPSWRQLLPLGVVPTEDLIARYEAGHEKEACRKADCEACQIREICQYSDPPIALEEDPAEWTMSAFCLSQAQKDVVAFERGVARVNAGPGSGKTLVVCMRVARLLMKGVDPASLLLVTFTNAAAREMRERIGFFIDDFGIDADVDKMRVCTFNAFGEEVLDTRWADLGYDSKPVIIDEVEKSSMIAELLEEGVKTDPALKALDYGNMDLDFRHAKGALAAAKEIFAAAKEQRLASGEENAVKAAQALGRDSTPEGEDVALIDAVLRLYDEYDKRLRAGGLIEYDDQIGAVSDSLFQDPYCLEGLGIAHIIVDEFQDTDERQMGIIKALWACPSAESLMVVGDDAQAIYGFRGATPDNIVRFPEKMGCPVTDFDLAEDRRSTPEIVALANKIDQKRPPENRARKTALVSTRPSGEPVKARGFFTKEEEAAFIAAGIKARLDAGELPENIAVIARTGQDLSRIAGALSAEGIASMPVYQEQVTGNSRIAAALALIAALDDREDTKGRAVYANALMGGGLGDCDPETIRAKIAGADMTVAAIRTAPYDGARKARLIEALKALDPAEDEIYEDFLGTLAKRDYEGMKSYAGKYARFGQGMKAKRAKRYPGVTLTTAHSSKGLEWPVVYLMSTGFIGGRKGAYTIDEETIRLLFVAVTRARDELIITGQYGMGGEPALLFDWDWFGEYLPEAGIVRGQSTYAGSYSWRLRKLIQDLLDERSGRKR